MLHIYLADTIPVNKLPKEFVRDAEAYFIKADIKGTPEQRALIHDIDCGSYLDNQYFLDRFGAKVSLRDISTGCKVGLLVSCISGKVINGQECGNNARDSIIRNIRNGSIYIKYNDISIDYPGRDDYEIDVCLNDKIRFTSLDRLNFYLDNELVGSGDIDYTDYPGYEVIGHV